MLSTSSVFPVSKLRADSPEIRSDRDLFPGNKLLENLCSHDSATAIFQEQTFTYWLHVWFAYLPVRLTFAFSLQVHVLLDVEGRRAS